MFYPSPAALEPRPRKRDLDGQLNMVTSPGMSPRNMAAKRGPIVQTLIQNDVLSPTERFMRNIQIRKLDEAGRGQQIPAISITEPIQRPRGMSIEF